MRLTDAKTMVFTKEDGILIKVLRQSKGYSARKLLEEFPDKHWSCSALDWLLRQIDSTGSADRKQRLWTKKIWLHSGTHPGRDSPLGRDLRSPSVIIIIIKMYGLEVLLLQKRCWSTLFTVSRTNWKLTFDGSFFLLSIHLERGRPQLDFRVNVPKKFNALLLLFLIW